MNIYFDTEFTDFVLDPALISIGLVADDGREFYAELNDTYDEVMCSFFVLETVLPILWGKEYEMGIEDIAPRLKAWIESFDESVTLWADAPSFDWIWIQAIFASGACGWPANLVGKCQNTQIFENDNERFRYNNAYEEYWRSKKNDGAVQHHALWDARGIRHAHRYAFRKRIGGS
jgi:hypothetical protein